MEEKAIKDVEVKLNILVVTKDNDGKETIIDKLVLNRIKLKVLKELPPGSLDDEGGTSYESIIPLIAASAKVPIEIVEEIDMIDLRRIMEAMEPFLPQSPQIGMN